MSYGGDATGYAELFLGGFCSSNCRYNFFVSQIIVGFYLLSEVSQIEVLAYAGVGLYVFSGLVFVLIGVPIFPLTYIDLIKADKDAIEKFGDDYRAYMKRVPRANFLLGILRRSQK